MRMARPCTAFCERFEEIQIDRLGRVFCETIVDILQADPRIV